MASSAHTATSQYFMQSLDRYVSTPLTHAQNALDNERSEIIAERDAFDAFRKQVLLISPEQTTTRGPVVGVNETKSGTDKMQTVRSAFRDTIMSVSHYDDEYGESLVTHLGAECSPALATGAQEDSSISFNSRFKRELQVEAARAIQARTRFLKTLENERESIERAADTIAELVDRLETTPIPRQERKEVVGQLDALSDNRQQLLHNRDLGRYCSDLSFCRYLYENYSWTYPVLTTITRVHETMIADR